MATDSGYSNQKKLGTAQFETIQSLGSDKYGKNVAVKALYEIMPAAAIVSVSSILGQSGQIQYWNIEITAHGAAVGNVLRLTSGTQINAEFEIMQVIDVDNVYVLPITSAIPNVAENAEIMGWVTQKLSSSGETGVTISTPPTSFEYDGAPQTVIQDTAVAANNRALPNLAFIYKDGVQVPITKDTATPANTVGMPVEIVAASGTPINITAGDLNVQLSDQGANADVVRIGDGTTQLGITVANEAKVHDADSLAKLTDIEALSGAKILTVSDVDNEVPIGVVGDNVKLRIFPNGALATYDVWTQADVNACVVQLLGLNTKMGDTATSPETNPAAASATQLQLLRGLLSKIIDLGTELALKADLSETQPVSVASLPLPTGAATEAKQDTLIAKDFATQTTLAALLVELALKADLSETQPVSIAAAIPSTINAGTITSAQIAVGLTAVRATVAGTAPNAARKKLMIKPSKNNTGAIYLGASGVTTGNGMEVIGPDRLEFEFDSGDYYLISDTAAQVVEIIEKV